MAKQQWCKDLRDGDTVGADFRVLDVQEALTKTGKPYRRFKIADKTGELPAVFWDCDTCGCVYKSNDIVFVGGTITLYQGKPQLKVERVGFRQSKDDHDFDLCTKYDVSEMWNRLVDYIGTMKNQSIRVVAEDLFLNQGYQDAFRSVPAATGMHHAFKGGLLEHTVQMCDIASDLLAMEFFQPLNRDLCLFGIAFHDFGKLFEYSAASGFPRTLQGNLVPHIPMVAALILESANKHGVPEIVRDHLMHVVLAHHGRIEWGSPVKMACPEAAFVHHVDNLHGTVFGYLQKIAKHPGQELVEHWGDGGKFFLVGESFNDILKRVETETAKVEAPPEGAGF